MARKIYLIGSLRNPEIPLLAERMRGEGHEVFDDWFCGGPEADDHWRDYHRGRGHTFPEAMQHPMAKHIFSLDKHWLDWADTAVMLTPCGKSGHLEMGYMAGTGKMTIAVVQDPERWDVMYQFLDAVVDDEDHLMGWLNKDYHTKRETTLVD